jgi:hypothetical protein
MSKKTKAKTAKTGRSIERQERRLVYFSTAQLRALKTAAKKLDTSMAELVRRGFDLVIAESAKRSGK